MPPAQLLRPLSARHLTPQARTVSTAATDIASRLTQKLARSTTVHRQKLDANQLQKLCLTLGTPRLGDVDVSLRPPPDGSPVPPGYHLVYFTPLVPEESLGPDGSDATFNAPAPFTRRMWAGGNMSWSGDALRVGDEVEERTRLLRATAKEGSKGDMVLVDVEKELVSCRGCSVVDRRAWIFRPGLSTPVMPVTSSLEDRVTVEEEIPQEDQPDDRVPARSLSWSQTALFRFSALTFNAHKIHYDQDWCQKVEGHPSPVVHGPLTLLSMLDHWRDVHGSRKQLLSIDYRALQPVYAGERYRVRTGSCEEVVAEKNGIVCMRAELQSQSRSSGA
ncbi:mesaconyl-C4 CoA hydratase [Ophiocordyceps camponoti-floridani]|uniref:Mesaconyl-C4 CoA hydratase n=1 Tax=Ophiocordyceps camponoti-floridani TaxID=2030778 RepID=A0A8H4QAK2_9HYPO|nr:mesaconyl-C4 CoA hydratase [Ophiocordyceps camponoti-floridani]